MQSDATGEFALALKICATKSHECVRLKSRSFGDRLCRGIYHPFVLKQATFAGKLPSIKWN